MQVVQNEQLLKREARFAWILLGFTFALLGGGFYMTLHFREPQGDEWLPIAITYPVVILGMVLYYFATTRLRRYGPQYRQDGKLRQLLKGLDDRYVLYTYLSKKLPDYLLVGPNGIFVLTTRIQEGEVICRRNRWSRRMGVSGRILGGFYGNPLGSPSYDTEIGVRRLRELLERGGVNAEQTPIAGLIVFTGNNVKLRLEACTFPATSGRELLKRVQARGATKLNSTRIAQIRQILEASQPI